VNAAFVGSLQRFADRVLGVATQHDKERVIGPALMRTLPLAGYHPVLNADTDRFGSFSGDVERTMDPLTTCILKAKHGAEVSGMDLVIASEGSFGPYPPAPFVPCDEEILVLFDARDNTLFHCKHVSLDTVFGGELCSSINEVMDFAMRMKFTEHQLLLRPREKWERGDAMHKGLFERDRLRTLASEFLARDGHVWVATDQRAMANPTRMRVIGDTAERFAQELARCCPACGEVWFRITEAIAGLPCQSCGWPTASVRAYRRSCMACAMVEDAPRQDGRTQEEPQHCQHCNP
jgi:hypothetical protein